MYEAYIFDFCRTSPDKCNRFLRRGDSTTTAETTAPAVDSETTAETEEVFDPFAGLPEKDHSGKQASSQSD